MTLASDVMKTGIRRVPLHASGYEVARTLKLTQLPVVVRDCSGFPMGVVTRRVMSERQKHPASTTAEQLMTPRLVLVRPAATLKDIQRTLKQKNVEQVFVADGIDILGVIDAQDVCSVVSRQKEADLVAA